MEAAWSAYLPSAFEPGHGVETGLLSAFLNQQETQKNTWNCRLCRQPQTEENKIVCSNVGFAEKFKPMSLFLKQSFHSCYHRLAKM
jgi:hypothetical protein